MDTVKILDTSGKELEQKKLDKEWVSAPVNNKLLRDVLLMHQANRRQGCASTKTRSEVAATGAKPWRQKGTGRARAGTSTSPIWRGGGVAFGPKPRSFNYSLPKKMRQKAREMAFASKIKEENLFVVKDLALKEAKTKEAAALLKQLNITGKVLIVLDNKEENVIRATRNIPGVTVVLKTAVSTYDILVNDTIIMAEGAFNDLLAGKIIEKGAKKAVTEPKKAPKETKVEKEEIQPSDKEEKQESE